MIGLSATEVQVLQVFWFQFLSMIGSVLAFLFSFQAVNELFRLVRMGEHNRSLAEKKRASK